jgi:hypothetical protein
MLNYLPKQLRSPHVFARIWKWIRPVIWKFCAAFVSSRVREFRCCPWCFVWSFPTFNCSRRFAGNLRVSAR